METVIWDWTGVFTGTVEKNEHPIVTLGRAGFVFTVDDANDVTSVNLNRAKEALTEGNNPRQIYISILITDTPKGEVN